MLSNTATPKYYGEFRKKVLAGEIPVCETVSLEMNRIDALIDNPCVYYDDEAVDGFICFCEEEMTLVDGSDVKLLPTFKLWAEQVWGWYTFENVDIYQPNQRGTGGRFIRKKKKKRLINKQIIILGRGGAKSLYDSYMQSYVENIDTSTTQQIVTAPTIRQTEEILAPIRTAIARARGPMFKFLTLGSLQNTTGSKMNRQMLCPTKKGIQNFLTNSIIEPRPMRIDKLQGLRPKLATIDEWLSGEVREDVIGAIEQGGSKLDDYLIIATSSEGTVRNGSGDTIKMELMKILKGEYKNDHVSIWWYKLDDIKEVADPDMWLKAQPNLGYTVSYETYQRDVEKAENNPASRNDILAKRFGIPMEGYTYFFTYEETLPTTKRADFWNMSCSLGADLSQGDDFCSFLFMFPLPGGRIGIKTRCYIKSTTMIKLQTALKLKYQDFMNEGSLCVLEGTYLDMDAVYDDLIDYIDQNKFDVCCLGYDPYNAKEFVERWSKENGEYGVEKVIQGAKTESVPLGELKDLFHNGDVVFSQELISFALGNAIVIEDTNGNRKLSKMRYDRKIDPVSALVDAWVAYKVNKDNF